MAQGPRVSERGGWSREGPRSEDPAESRLRLKKWESGRVQGVGSAPRALRSKG